MVNMSRAQMQKKTSYIAFAHFMAELVCFIECECFFLTNHFCYIDVCVRICTIQSEKDRIGERDRK